MAFGVLHRSSWRLGDGDVEVVLPLGRGSTTRSHLVVGPGPPPPTRTLTPKLLPQIPNKCTRSDRDPDPAFSTPRRVASPLSRSSSIPPTKHCEPRIQDDSDDKCTLRFARCSVVLSTPTILDDADLCLLILETKQIVISASVFARKPVRTHSDRTPFAPTPATANRTHQ